MGKGCASRVNAAWACYLALSSTLGRSVEISRAQYEPIFPNRDYIRLLDAEAQIQWRKLITCVERTKFIDDLAENGAISEDGRRAIVRQIQKHCQPGGQVDLDVMTVTSPNFQTQDEISEFPSPSSLFSTDAGVYFDSLVKTNRDYLSKVRLKATELQNHYKDTLAKAQNIIDQHFPPFMRQSKDKDQRSWTDYNEINERSCFRLLDGKTVTSDVAKQTCNEMKHKCAGFDCAPKNTICRICVGIGSKKSANAILYKKTAWHMEWDAYKFEIELSLQKFKALRQERDKQIRKNHLEVEDMFQAFATTSQRSQKLEDLKERAQNFSRHWQGIADADAHGYINELTEFAASGKKKTDNYIKKLSDEESQGRDITNKELAQHVEGSNCWVAVNGTVFDISYIVLAHPISLETYCGNDVTEHYTAMHRDIPDISRSMGSSRLDGTILPVPTDVKSSWDFKEDELPPPMPFGTASFMQSPSVADNMVAEPLFLQESGSSRVRLVRKMDP